MENFNTNHGRTKEKSVYLLHLDTPRIILLASVIIGLLVVSFIVGMNSFKGDNSDQMFTRDRTMFDKGSNIDIKESSLPGLLNSDIVVKNNREMPGIDEFQNDGGTNASGKDKMKMEADVLTSDNIKEVILPSGNIKKNIASKSSSKKVRGTNKIAKKPALSKRKRTARVKTKKSKSRVIEVSNYNKRKRIRSTGYSIQIASFDRKSKAEKEMRSLRGMKFDAHVTGTRVKGKKYYRVKVGPLSSKRKTLNLLSDIQGNSRYSGSYMVKE